MSRTTSPEFESLFLSLDDGIHLETPEGFDWTTALDRVESLKGDLESVLGIELRLDQPQDASYFASLADYEPDKDGMGRAVVDYRFSAFGQMVCCWQDPLLDDRLSQEQLTRADEVLTARGYLTIPFQEADTPYTGPLADRFGAYTWWWRFFDYL